MTIEVQGFCEDRFAPLRDAFVGNFDAGRELGASLAVTWQGRMVVDLWGGWADLEMTRPWQADTIVPVASTTKVMSTLIGLWMVDRGLIELDAPVARYWPEFAEGGKAAVTIRDAFSHQAGAPGFATPISFETYCDWDALTARHAAEPHWFDGRRQVIYHPYTFGLPLSVIARRLEGRTLRQMFRDEFAEPAGADFHIGLTSKSQLARVATVKEPERRGELPPGSLLEKLLRSITGFEPSRWAFQSAELPAGGGIGNARSIARLCAIVAMGGALDGVRYLSADIVEEAVREQGYGECPYLGWARFGLGFGMNSIGFKYPSPTTVGWGGTGGSWAIMDPKAGVSLGYAPNDFSIEPNGVIDPRQGPIGKALYKLLPTL